LLSLSLAELFGGFARTLRARDRIRIGWLSPLLALLMVVDLVSFWVNSWGERADIPLTFPTLLFGAGIAGIYYIAAALVFPEHMNEWDDLDRHFCRQKVWVVLAVQVSNLLFIGGEIMLHGNFFNAPVPFIKLGLWVGTGLALILARPRWLNLLMLLFYLQLYWVTRAF